MELIDEKAKLMTNGTNGVKTEIKVKGQKLCTVTIFKYLRAVVSDGVQRFSQGLCKPLQLLKAKNQIG